MKFASQEESWLPGDMRMLRPVGGRSVITRYLSVLPVPVGTKAMRRLLIQLGLDQQNWFNINFLTLIEGPPAFVKHRLGFSFGRVR